MEGEFLLDPLPFVVVVVVILMASALPTGIVIRVL